MQSLCVAVICLLFCAGNVGAKTPLPQFFGVYALYDGKLIEMQSHPQGQYAISGMTVMGADVISKLSGITFRDGTIEFIIFRDSATTFNKIPLSKIARIDMEANTAWGGDGTKKRLKNRYHLMPGEIYMNVAPLKEMMVRVVPKSPLSPGIWAIKIGSELYDFVVGSEESADCVIRKIGAGGVEYTLCSQDQRTEKGEQKSPGKFVTHRDGTFTDIRTGLMWAAKDNGNPINWPNARSYCQNFTGGGYTDWRMPTQDELAGLYDKEKGGLYNITPLIELTYGLIWASDTRGSEAAIVDFQVYHDYRGWNGQSNYYNRALPVRSGK